MKVDEVGLNDLVAKHKSIINENYLHIATAIQDDAFVHPIKKLMITIFPTRGSKLRPDRQIPKSVKSLVSSSIAPRSTRSSSALNIDFAEI